MHHRSAGGQIACRHADHHRIALYMSRPKCSPLDESEAVLAEQVLKIAVVKLEPLFLGSTFEISFRTEDVEAHSKARRSRCVLHDRHLPYVPHRGPRCPCHRSLSPSPTSVASAVPELPRTCLTANLEGKPHVIHPK